MIRKFIHSIRISVLNGLDTNEYIKKWNRKYPRTMTWIKHRCAFRKPYGFYFSVCVLLAVYFGKQFIDILREVLVGGAFLELDIRVTNLLSVLRTDAMNRFMVLWSYGGNWQFIVSLGIIIIIGLLLVKEKRKALFLFFGTALGELLYSSIKAVVGRTRPDEGFALITQGGYSFPSGHATMAVLFFGMIWYGCITAHKKWWQRIGFTLFFGGIIFFISISRVYLGVHWASDVIGGWSLGALLLVLIIGFFKNDEHKNPEKKENFILAKSKVVLIMLVLLGVHAYMLGVFYKNHPIKNSSIAQQGITNITKDDFYEVIHFPQFPKFSETLIGERMGPVSFIVIGSREDLIRVFKKSGWSIADDPVRIKNLEKLAVAGILNTSYDAAPVTPSLLHARPHDIAFLKSTPAHTVRERHHTRYWFSGYYVDGVPVWVATASFDNGIKYYITHSIAPDIDTERDFILNDLMQTGQVIEQKEIQFVPPLLGENQGKDQFFTDGKAYVLRLQ